MIRKLLGLPQKTKQAVHRRTPRRFFARMYKVRRSGLSLLEVVLALAILAVTATMLAQITRQATDNAMMAQRLATAQIMCESKMAEVLVGAIAMQPTDWTPITDSTRPGNWHYKIETTTADQPDMLGVRVSVSDDPTKQTGNPELFFLVRWVIDPAMGLDSPPAATDASGGQATATSGAAGGTQ